MTTTYRSLQTAVLAGLEAAGAPITVHQLLARLGVEETRATVLAYRQAATRLEARGLVRRCGRQPIGRPGRPRDLWVVVVPDAPTA